VLSDAQGTHASAMVLGQGCIWQTCSGRSIVRVLRWAAASWLGEDLMRTFRIWALLLAVLSLPLPGLTALAQARISKSVSAAHLTTATEQMPTMSGDCCPTDATKQAPCESPGKGDSCSTCPFGLSCRTPQTFQTVQFPDAVAIVFERQPISEHALRSIPPRPPDRHWRPPASI